MANSKLVSSRTYSGTFPSLEASPCGEDETSVEVPKGWSSEHVPRSSYRSRRHVASAALMPFNSGRTLPSKWEDAERWICSPVSVGNVSTTTNNNNTGNSNSYYVTGPKAGTNTTSQLAQYQRRVKSKSGPLGPHGPMYYGGGYNSFSPVLGVGVINGGRQWRNSLAIDSPSLASTRFDEKLGIEGGGGGGGGGSEGGRRSCPGHASDATTRWLDSWSGPTSPTHLTQGGEVALRDENNDKNNNPEQENNCNDVLPRVDKASSRRDMATQMYPGTQSCTPSSAVSSPKSSISATSPSPLLLNRAKRDVHYPEYEVRDVQVDKQASSTRSRPNNANNGRSHDQLNSSLSIEAGDKFSKFQRKEARISAWENLQKAKAESAIQKLEEKLEKKRASSMNKIIQKLQKAEIKARKMRSSLSSGSDQPESRALAKTASKLPSFCKKIRLYSSSTKGCSTCYPF